MACKKEGGRRCEYYGESEKASYGLPVVVRGSEKASHGLPVMVRESEKASHGLPVVVRGQP